MLLMQLPIQMVAVPAALAPQGAAPTEPRSLGGCRAPGVEVPPPPPPVAMARATSRGSKNHFKGQCRPCRFHEAPEKCPRGEDCNFCHFPHGEEKFAQLEAFNGRARGRRPRTGAGPREGQPAHPGYPCPTTWTWWAPGAAGSSPPYSSSSSSSSWSRGEHAEALVLGAAWPGLSAEGRRRLELLLQSAQPERYDD
ncbi:unnamed protein product [Prorocentrum cordatum]|uniref:C3H1-type domain-containing protein n=1 Tax=Prorocentrum cordatum TaxID=2364126 RepID=A0ABN9UJB2_9DINO|nr:unnamed protein product [Polarella glacialis]